jgi:hypothetical protein
VTDITPNFEEGKFPGKGKEGLGAHDAPRFDVLIRMTAPPGPRMTGRGLSFHARLPEPWKTSAFMAVLVLRVSALLVASPSSAVLIDISQKVNYGKAVQKSGDCSILHTYQNQRENAVLCTFRRVACPLWIYRSMI